MGSTNNDVTEVATVSASSSSLAAGDVARNLRAVATQPTATAQQSTTAPGVTVTKAVVTSSSTPTTFKRIRERTVQRTRAERIFDTTKANLEIYRTAKIGTPAKAEALAKVLDAALRSPSRSLLNLIYDFFRANRNESFLSPINALQGTTDLERITNLKLRLFYDIMMRLANNEANNRTLNMDMIKTVFKNEDFTNWISHKMRNLNRNR